MSVYALKGRVIDSVADHMLENGLVIVDGEQIVYAGIAAGYTIPEGAQTIEVPDGTILPGFIDCHAHFDGTGPEPTYEFTTPHLDLILNSAYGAGILLDAGFTSLREMSSFGPHLKKAINRRVLRGPRIMPGGRVLSVSGGHADSDVDFPIEYSQQHSIIGYLVDGVDECIRGVRLQFREGAEFIKICATGGVSSSADGINDIQFSFEEVRAMVEEAERHDTYVTAHCTGNAGTYQALKAGVRCVEHGIFLDERCIDWMVKNDVSLVTTLSVSQGIPKLKGLVPDFLYEKGCKCAEAHLKSMEMARKAGIRIALGTDYSNTKNTPYAETGKEFGAIVKAGFTPMEAIKMGTINGAYLMKMADKIGSLEKGKLADVVIVNGNPLEDIQVLAHKDHVKVVFKNGVMEKRNKG